MQRLALVSLFSFFAWAVFCQEELISEESFPITILQNAINCIDEQLPHGFFPYEPGTVSLLARSVSDTTGLIKENAYFTATFSNRVTCSDLWQALAQVPSSLVATRKVFRKIVPTWYERDKSQSEIHAEVSIAIPVVADTTNLVLTDSESSWLEQYFYTTEQPPLDALYAIRTHPQAADRNYGLSCSPKSPNSADYQLSMGGFSGDYIFYHPANTSKIFSAFADETSCNEAQQRILAELKIEDPENNGTIFRVQRLLRWSYRLINANSEVALCHQFQRETISTTFKGYTFLGSQDSFAMKTVPLELCSAKD